MLPLLFFIIGAVIIILNFIGRTKNNIQQSNAAYEYAKQTVEKENITISKELQYNLLLVQKLRIIVDDKSKKMHIFYMNNPKLEIPYKKLMGCEVYHNGTIVGGVKRALVGGVIAGGAGAVVGALTANKKVSSIGLKISQNDLTNPEIILPLIDPATDGEAPKDKNLCQEALNFANSVVATVNVILKQNNEQNSAMPNRVRSDIGTNQSKENSNFEAIKKYKELLDMGIITQAEFNAKKAELLGIGQVSHASSPPMANQSGLSSQTMRQNANTESYYDFSDLPEI